MTSHTLLKNTCAVHQIGLSPVLPLAATGPLVVMTIRWAFSVLFIAVAMQRIDIMSALWPIASHALINGNQKGLVDGRDAAHQQCVRVE